MEKRLSPFDWSHAEYKKVLNDFIASGESCMKLGSYKTTDENKKQIIEWAKQDGYEAEITDFYVTIWLKNKSETDEVRLLDIVENIQNFIKEHGNAKVLDVGFQLEVDEPCATVLNHYIKTDKGSVTFYKEQRGVKQTCETNKKRSIAIVCENFTTKHTEFLKWHEILEKQYGKKMDFKLSDNSLSVAEAVVTFVLDTPLGYDFVFDYTENKETILKAIQGEG